MIFIIDLLNLKFESNNPMHYEKLNGEINTNVKSELKA